MEKIILNHRHFRDFTIIPNEILRNNELTFFDKGVLCYLLSLPNNWEIKVEFIVETFQESERAILRSLRNLIDSGYCKRVPKRVNGKLSGQMYLITDIPFNFSAPAKNEGTGNAEAADSRPAEIPAPLKNEGAEENNNIIQEYNLFNKEENRVPARDSASERKCLFENSKFYDFEKFRERLESDPDIGGQDIDLYYYYNRVKNWSGGNGQKKNNWILTVKNWMMDDAEKGKLKRKTVGMGALPPDAIKYLQDMAD